MNSKHKYSNFHPIKTVWKTISSTYLCLRFPFLYPRNRFTGQHYNNWKLDKKIEQLFNDSHKCLNPVDFSKIRDVWTDADRYNLEHPDYCVTNVWKSIQCSALKIYRSVLRKLHCIPTYTELDAMEKGWRKQFGIEMCTRLKKALKKTGNLKTYRIMQIKEKWGELCWYSGGGNHETFNIEREYEDKSAKMCIVCGRPAKYLTRGWICPYCEEHLPENKRDSGGYQSIDEPKFQF